MSRFVPGVVLGLLLSAVASPSRAATFTVNSLADPGAGGCDAAECTLREAIAAAAAAGGADTVAFAGGLSGTITLNAELALLNHSDLIIDGPGPQVLAVSGNNAVRVFRLLNANNVTIRDLTIRNGNAGGNLGAGILVDNGGSPLLENLRVINNQTTQAGAGVSVFFAGATIRNCEISGNTGARGSGLFINGSAGHNVLVENTTVSGNVGNQGEAGINVLTNSGQFVVLRNVTVAANSGSPFGAILDGQVTIESSVFADHVGGSADLQFTGTAHNTIVERMNGTLDGGNNLTGTDPGLLALTFVGASATRVHPFHGGAARDHVDPGFGANGCGTLLTTDQLGRPRPSGPRCDAGAFEAQAPSVLADWTFEDLAPGQPISVGQRVPDSSGNTRDARAAGPGDLPVAVPGRLDFGTALAFGSNVDRVLFQDGFIFGDGGPPAGTDIDFAAADSFTLEALVRIPAGSPQVGAIVSKATNLPNGGRWFLRIGNGRLQGLVGGSTSGSTQVTGATNINDGNWHHVAMVRDALADQVRIFVDGVQDGAAADATVGDLSSTQDIVIAAFADATTPLEGDVDFVRISLGALSPAEFVPVPPGVDLVTTITDGVAAVRPGDLVDYTVTVSNNGGQTATGVQVSDTLPPEIVASTWTCSPSGGATCSASGTGGIADTITVPVGGAATYTLSATITSMPFTSVTYSAGATTASQPEQNAANNSATDVNLADALFQDGFENPPTPILATGKVLVDLTRVDAAQLGLHPRAVAKSADAGGRTTRWLHARRVGDQLEVRISRWDASRSIWTVGAWTPVPRDRRIVLDW